MANSSTPASAAEIWDDLNLHEHIRYLNSVLLQAKLLFREAVLSFDAGAHAGASLLCRSTLEAACYLFLTRIEIDPTKAPHAIKPPEGLDLESSFSVTVPRALSGAPRRVSWDEILTAVRKRKILKGDQLKDLGRIRRRGNIVAHLASRQDESRHKRRRGRRGSLWIQEEEALKDLQDTADILKRLADLFAFWPEHIFSGPFRKNVSTTETWWRETDVER